MTAWTTPATPPVIGVLGPRALTERLGCRLSVRRFMPHDHAAAEVDAVLVARSAFAPGGSWAAALRPVGFDRGVALAAVLADAGAADVPVVLLEDLPPAALVGWDTMLDGAVDEALALGPLGAGDVCWHPGEHWDATALRLAVARPPARRGGCSVVTAASARHGWQAVQREGAARGRVDVDPDDPWSRHLAGELIGLGVDARGAGTRAPVPRDGATPSAAAAWLCARLGLAVPDDLRSGAAAWIVRGDRAEDPDATACRDALDRVCAAEGLVLRVGAALAATPDIAAVGDAEEGGLLAASLDLGALA